MAVFKFAFTFIKKMTCSSISVQALPVNPFSTEFSNEFGPI